MSQRNFVEQFNLFMEYAKRNKLTSYERVFYFALFSCANEHARQEENYEWPDDYFTASNAELIGWTGFDERAIRNTRNSLKQKGLIDFQKGDGKKRDPSYRLFYMKRNGYKIAPDSLEAWQQTGSKNTGGQHATGYKNAGDKPPAPSTDCKSAGDYVPDDVSDPVPDDVSDPVVIGCEFAGEHFIINKPNVGTNANAKENVVVEPVVDARETAGGVQPAEEPDQFSYSGDFGKAMDFYRNNFNAFPPELTIAGIRDFVSDLGGDVVIHAMQAAMDEKKYSWAYLRGILNRYRREGLTSLEAVEAADRQFSARKSGRRGSAASPQRRSHGYGLVNMGTGPAMAGGLVPGLGKKGW